MGRGEGAHVCLQRWARPLAADRALVHRAARRLGHPASIPCAIMRHSPSGPAVISFRRRYHCPSAGAFLTGLATAVGPASRRGSRVGAMLTLLRLPPSPACASLRRDLVGPIWGTKMEARCGYHHRAARSVWAPVVVQARFAELSQIGSINGPYTIKWFIYDTNRLTARIERTIKRPHKLKCAVYGPSLNVENPTSSLPLCR